MNNFTLYTDGGSRGNPGHSAIGYLCYKNGKLVFKNSEYIGINTNNFAEYTALIKGLGEAHKQNIKTITCFLDSELVVKQLNNIYKVKNENIIPLYKKVVDIKSKFNKVTFIHIVRSKNKEADALVNEALNKHLSLWI